MSLELNTLISIVAVVFAGVSALASWLALRSWRAQMKAADRRRLAGEVAEAAIRLRNAFSSARSPLILPEEQQAAASNLVALGMSAESLSQLTGEGLAFSERGRVLGQRFGELEAIAPKIEFMWDISIEHNMRGLRCLQRKWRNAVKAYLENGADWETQGYSSRGEIRTVVYANNDLTDDFTRRVQNACDDIVDLARVHHKV